ncbi:MAG: hypothetical protein U0703_25025 [Anaerolineae bacterium]
MPRGRDGASVARSAAALAASMPAPERQRALVDDLIALLPSGRAAGLR